MKTKRYVIFIICAIVFVLTALNSLRLSSYDNIYCKKQGFEDRMIQRQEVGFSSEEDGSIVSLYIYDIDTYVYTLRFNGRINGAENAKVYYTEAPEENFSEEGSFETAFFFANGKPSLKPDRYIYSLRIDMDKTTDVEKALVSMEINDTSPIVDSDYILGYSVFPTLVLFILLSALSGLKVISAYFAVFKKYCPLLKNLVSRDLSVKYRRSVLGFLWSILNPLLMALIVNAVFSHLFRFSVEYFIIYYLLGSVLFTFMTESTTGSMMSIIYAAGLIKKVYIPKYIFPMQKCVFAFINMLFSIVAVLVMIFITGMPLTPTALLFPIPLIYTAVFSLGLGLILASLTVFFRDIEHLYTVFVSAWIYMTPIIYPENILTNSLKMIMKLNPMYYFVTYFRDLVMYNTIPGLGFNLVCMAFSLIFLLIGLAVFKKCQDRFILYI